MTTPDYPWRGPFSGHPGFTRNRDEGWKLSRRHEAELNRQLDRLKAALVPAGWEVHVHLDVDRETVGVPAMAFLNVFINGSSQGFTLVPGETFDSVPEQDRRWYGIRVFGDELPEGVPATCGQCVNEVIRRLPQNVSDVIEHFSRYDLTKHSR